MLQVTFARPITASLTGSFSRPANTPFVTTVAKAAKFVKIAGTASLMKQVKILYVVGCSDFGLNISSTFSSFSWIRGYSEEATSSIFFSELI